MPEKIILKGRPPIFSWFKENITDPTLMAGLEQCKFKLRKIGI